MPVITAKMGSDEKQVMDNILIKTRECKVHPGEIREEMISFIEDLMHKSFSEGLIHSS